MKVRSVTPMQIAKTGYIVISIILCMIGVLFIVLPEMSAELLVRTSGVAMLIFGVIKLIGYFSKELFRLAFQYDLEFGILLLVIGGIVLMKPHNAISFICIAFGLAILADGLFKIRIASDARRFGIRSWWLILVLAVISALVGMLLVLRPHEGSSFLMGLLGVSLLSEGCLNLDVAISTVKIIKHQISDMEIYEKGRVG